VDFEVGGRPTADHDGLGAETDPRATRTLDEAPQRRRGLARLRPPQNDDGGVAGVLRPASNAGEAQSAGRAACAARQLRSGVRITVSSGPGRVR
jgi:hypothetical protein